MFNILRALHQPWLIEPQHGQKWANIVMELINPSALTTPVNPREHNTENLPYIKDGVMVLPVSGPLMKAENCGTPGTANMLASIQQAQTNPEIQAIVLQIDSPGGTVDGTKVLADAVKASKKPVVTFVDGLMASGAMWIGSGATEIIASSNIDMIGSIGTMVQWADFTEHYKQKGVTINEAYATESSDKNQLFKQASATGDHTELITKVLDPINNEFLGAIKANRAGKLSTKENVLTGKMYMATDAKKYGLIDKIGTLESAIKRAKALSSLNTQSNKMENNENNTAFTNVLAAAKSNHFTLVDDIGFGLTEDQLNNIDASIANLQNELATATATIAENATAINNAGEALTAAQNTIAAQVTKITELEATVAKYAPLKAAAQADPAPEGTEYADNTKILTTVDAEAAKLYAYRNRKKA